LVGVVSFKFNDVVITLRWILNISFNRGGYVDFVRISQKICNIYALVFIPNLNKLVFPSIVVSGV